MITSLLLVSVLLNFIVFIGLLNLNLTTKELFNVKGVPLFSLLLIPLLIPAIVLYLFIKLLMWKPFGE